MPLSLQNRGSSQATTDLARVAAPSPCALDSRPASVAQSPAAQRPESCDTCRARPHALWIIGCGPIIPGDPPMPAPELLTEAEAVRYLRLDCVEIADPSATLRRYREMGLLKGTQVSKRVFYRRIELDRFLERATESNPR